MASTTSGIRLEGTDPIARPYEPAFSRQRPPSTTWKWGTVTPLILRLLPKNPMSATWCWPQELKQPLTLMRRPRTASSSSNCVAARRVRSSPASPREDAMPSLQVSVPGHEVTSTIVPAPGAARSMSASAW